MMYFLDFRARDQGGPVLPGRLMTIEGHAPQSEDDLRHESRMTFLIHGFNVNRPNGQATLARLAASLPTTSVGALVAVSWPGDSWAKFASYPLEGNDADDTAAELARFVDRVALPGTLLSFVSHSLGARVVMGTIKRVRGRYPVNQVCTMAAAIDDFSLANPRDYGLIAPHVGRIAVLASRKDKVLRLAYPVGDLVQAFLFFRRDRRGGALGYHGPKPSGSHAVPPNVFCVQVPEAPLEVDHGDYFPGGATPNEQQKRAARFADAVLSGIDRPPYQ
jgi:hypothetical protein